MDEPLLQDEVRPCSYGGKGTLLSLFIGSGFTLLLGQVSCISSAVSQQVTVQETGIALASHKAMAPRFHTLYAWIPSFSADRHHSDPRVMASTVQSTPKMQSSDPSFHESKRVTISSTPVTSEIPLQAKVSGSMEVANGVLKQRIASEQERQAKQEKFDEGTQPVARMSPRTVEGIQASTLEPTPSNSISKSSDPSFIHSFFKSQRVAQSSIPVAVPAKIDVRRTLRELLQDMEAYLELARKGAGAEEGKRLDAKVVEIEKSVDPQTREGKQLLMAIQEGKQLLEVISYIRSTRKEGDVIEKMTNSTEASKNSEAKQVLDAAYNTMIDVLTHRIASQTLDDHVDKPGNVEDEDTATSEIPLQKTRDQGTSAGVQLQQLAQDMEAYLELARKGAGAEEGKRLDAQIAQLEKTVDPLTQEGKELLEAILEGKQLLEGISYIKSLKTPSGSEFPVDVQNNGKTQEMLNSTEAVLKQGEIKDDSEQEREEEQILEEKSDVANPKGMGPDTEDVVRMSPRTVEGVVASTIMPITKSSNPSFHHSFFKSKPGSRSSSLRPQGKPVGAQLRELLQDMEAYLDLARQGLCAEEGERLDAKVVELEKIIDPRTQEGKQLLEAIQEGKQLLDAINRIKSARQESGPELPVAANSNDETNNMPNSVEAALKEERKATVILERSDGGTQAVVKMSPRTVERAVSSTLGSTPAIKSSNPSFLRSFHGSKHSANSSIPAPAVKQGEIDGVKDAPTEVPHAFLKQGEVIDSEKEQGKEAEQEEKSDEGPVASEKATEQAEKFHGKMKGKAGGRGKSKRKGDSEKKRKGKRTSDSEKQKEAGEEEPDSETTKTVEAEAQSRGEVSHASVNQGEIKIDSKQGEETKHEAKSSETAVTATPGAAIEGIPASETVAPGTKSLVTRNRRERGDNFFRKSSENLQKVGNQFLHGSKRFLSRNPKKRLLEICAEMQANGISATPAEQDEIKILVTKLISLNPTKKPALAFAKQSGLWRMMYTDWPSEQGKRGLFMRETSQQADPDLSIVAGKFGPFTGDVFQQVDPKVEGGIISSWMQGSSSVFRSESDLVAKQAVLDESTWRINFEKVVTNVAGIPVSKQNFGLYDKVWLWRYLYLDDDLRVWRAFRLGDDGSKDQDYLFVTAREYGLKLDDEGE